MEGIFATPAFQLQFPVSLEKPCVRRKAPSGMTKDLGRGKSTDFSCASSLICSWKSENSFQFFLLVVYESHAVLQERDSSHTARIPSADFLRHGYPSIKQRSLLKTTSVQDWFDPLMYFWAPVTYFRH